MTTNVVEQRTKFARDYRSGHWTMTELCDRYGVSRPTGYKWIARSAVADGAPWHDHSRAPQTCPHRTAADIEALVVATRRHFRWGATKLLTVLARQYPDRTWPTRSTVNVILDRHGLLHKRRRRRTRLTHPGAPPVVSGAPNEVWPADFKGQFKLGNGTYCYPLTVTDHYSRALLLCHALSSTQTVAVYPRFLALFREIGLPDAIRTDNGPPFASTGLCGLSALNLWWIQLGIVHQRLRPGYPQGNGTHERMHRELKAATTGPAAATARGQQRRFDAFQQRYNEERPHEGIGLRTPAMLWQPSRRPYPARLAPPEYAAHTEVRRVKSGGCVKFRGRLVFLSHVLERHDVALEEVTDGVWNLWFYQSVLGRLDERTWEITGG